MTRIAVLDDYQQVALSSADWSALAGRAEIVVFSEHIGDPRELVTRLAGFDVAVAMRERTAFPAAVLQQLPDLRLIVTTGAANAAIDVGAARALGIEVCGTSSSAAAAPELTWALLLALVRHVPIEDANMRAGRWQSTVGLELSGRTIGLLGLGRVGQYIARYARAFDMQVLAWSEYLTPAVAAEHGARKVGMGRLFADSDIVSVHLRLSDRTRGLVGAAELNALGPHGLLVNTSRGPIVDEAALVAALRAGTLGGAALDVYDREPLPADHRLRTAPRTVLTPHIGYVTHETYEIFFGQIVEDILAWLDRLPMRRV